MEENRDIIAVFIAGPTASGKSSTALEFAATRDGEIVNADAMQVYNDLRIITARPSKDDEKLCPHHLYGVLDGQERCSAGRWALMAVEVMADIKARGKLPILVGGTGLYFKALEEGLSPIPNVPDEIRSAAEARRLLIGPEAFHAEVLSIDPEMARLPIGDKQRLTRAWEVYHATGKPLTHFQNLPRVPLMQGPIEKHLILRDRKDLYDRCNRRFGQMIDEGALEEVRTLMDKHLDPALPILKSLGVPELSAYLRGDLTIDEALEKAKMQTRRFAKRQMTWFRGVHWD